MGHATLLLGRLHRFEPIGLIAFFHPEDGVTTGIVADLDVGGIGTQRVCGDDALEVGVILAQRGADLYKLI